MSRPSLSTVAPLADLSVDEIAGLADLERRIFERAAHYDSEAWTAENFGRSLPEKGDLSFVARRGGRVVGFLIASRSTPDEVRTHRLGVDPDWTGQGIAASLLARLVEVTNARISLRCHPDNEGAIALYGSFGFKRQLERVEGKLVFDLPARNGQRAWYIYNTVGMGTGHASHVPSLIDAMAEISPTAPIGYGSPEFPRLTPTLHGLRAFGRVLKRARAERVRVIFVRINWPLAALLSLAGRALGWKVVLWSSGGTGILPGTTQPVGARLTRAAWRAVLRRGVAGVATGPPSVAREYVRRYRLSLRRMLLVSNDVDVARWTAQRPADGDTAGERSDMMAEWLAAPYRVLFVHRLDEIRGADLLPAMATALAERLPGVKVLAVGDGPVRARLSAADHVLAPGPVTNDVVPWLLRHAQVLLVPSRQEGFPRVVLEGLAAACPPVCMDVGGCSDIVGSRLRPRLIAQSTDEMVALAAEWCTSYVADDALHDALVARARHFDTPIVARRLVTTIGMLAVAGTGPAHRVSWAGWQDTFGTDS